MTQGVRLNPQTKRSPHSYGDDLKHAGRLGTTAGGRMGVIVGVLFGAGVLLLVWLLSEWWRDR